MSRKTLFEEMAELLNQATIGDMLTTLRDEGFTAANIAEKMEISSSCVQDYAKRYGVDFAQRKLPLDTIRDLRNSGMSWQAIADAIGSHKSTVIHASKRIQCTA